MIVYKCDMCKKEIPDVVGAESVQILTSHGVDRAISVEAVEWKLIHCCDKQCEAKLLHGINDLLRGGAKCG